MGVLINESTNKMPYHWVTGYKLQHALHVTWLHFTQPTEVSVEINIAPPLSDALDDCLQYCILLVNLHYFCGFKFACSNLFCVFSLQILRGCGH